jgi:large subunit ribosomal protein L1
MDFLTALKELRKSEKRNFDQTVDLIVNLKNYDLRIKPINLFVELPHAFRENKICAFLEADNPDVDRVITKLEMPKISDKKEIKKLARDYDLFISSMKLMPAIATTFGKILGPMGKMPNPKFGGVIAKEEPALIKEVVRKLKKMVSIRPKELSIKIAVGKESMKDEDINENIKAIYNSLMTAFTNENVKSILLKFTMSKPVKV